MELGTFDEAAAHGEMVVNATAGAVSLEALELAGEENLNGKVLVDVIESAGLLAGYAPYAVGVEHRLAGRANTEEVRRSQGGQDLAHHERLPDGRPRSARRGRTHGVRLRRRRGGEGQGDRAAPRLRLDDILDLGDISAARGTEMIMPIWLRLFGALQKPVFNFKIVR